MKLKSFYENVEDIPQGTVKDFFLEQENGYTLDGEGIVTQELHTALEKSFQKQKQLTRQIEKQRDEALGRIPAGFDEDKWASFVTWQDTHAEGDPDPKMSLEVREEKIRDIRLAAEAKARKEHQVVLKEKDDRLTFLQSSLEEEVKRNALEKALHDVRIKPKHFKMVRAFHEKQIRTIEEDHAGTGKKEFRAVVEVDGIERDVDKYIEEWASSEQGLEYVEPLRTLGGGQNGDGTRFRRPAVNPFKKESYNLTAQGQLRKTNPQLYEELKQAAASGA